MRLLIDTNIFLEIMLGQEKANDAIALLSITEQCDFFVSDFSLHSIGILLFYRNQQDIYRQFIKDMIIDAGVLVVSLSLYDMEKLLDHSLKFSLDFDDAYQYATAEKYDLAIVSFDSDFDRTSKGRKTPESILKLQL